MHNRAGYLLKVFDARANSIPRIIYLQIESHFSMKTCLTALSFNKNLLIFGENNDNEQAFCANIQH